MIVLEIYDDGTQSEMLEVGDRVRVIRKGEDDWILTKGDMATVVEVDKPQSTVSMVDIRTDEMVKGNWGIHGVQPWYVEFVENEDERKLPKKVIAYINKVRDGVKQHNAKSYRRKKVKKLLMGHQQRLIDIKNGNFSHFDKSYVYRLKVQSEEIVKDPSLFC